MADNAQRTPGTGEAIAADEVTDGTLGSCKVQYVKLMDGTLDGTTKAAVGANGLACDVKNASIAGTAGTANSGVLSVQGIASMTPVQVTVNSITAGDNNIGNVDIVSLPASVVTGGIQWTNVSNSYSTAQTSADVVALSGSTKFYIGCVRISTGYVASATTTMVKLYLHTGAWGATEQTIFAGEFSTIPGTGLVSYPGVVIGNGAAPFCISAAGDALKITTSASTHCIVYVSVDYIRV